MNVDVIYQGLPIARGAAVCLEEGSLFIKMDGPMPVSTRLTLAAEGKRLDGLVQRVREGVGAGVYFAAEGGALPDWIRPLRPGPVEAVESAVPPEPVSAAPPVPPEPVSAAPPVPPEPMGAAPPQTAQEVPSGAPPPLVEATQEMAVPGLDEGLNGDGDSGPVERRPLRKKKTRRR